MNATNDRRIDYIEFPAIDLEKTRLFYYTVFGWKFEDYGPDYTSFMMAVSPAAFARRRKSRAADR